MKCISCDIKDGEIKGLKWAIENMPNPKNYRQMQDKVKDIKAENERLGNAIEEYDTALDVLEDFKTLAEEGKEIIPEYIISQANRVILLNTTGDSAK